VNTDVTEEKDQWWGSVNMIRSFHCLCVLGDFQFQTKDSHFNAA